MARHESAYIEIIYKEPSTMNTVSNTCMSAKHPFSFVDESLYGRIHKYVRASYVYTDLHIHMTFCCAQHQCECGFSFCISQSPNIYIFTAAK